MKYKIIKKGEPGVIGGGNQQFYASPYYSGEVDLYGLGQKLATRSTVARIDAEAVLSGFVNLISEELKEGKIVRLGNLGTFRISLNSRGEENASEVNGNSIQKTRVLSRPAKVFNKHLSGLDYEMVKDVVANPFTNETDTTA